MNTWSSCSLAAVAAVDRGLSWDRANECAEADAAANVVTIPNIQEALILPGNTYVKDVPVDKLARYELAAGDILMVGSNGNRDRVGYAVRTAADHPKVLFASFLMRIRATSPSVDSRFLYYVVKSQTFLNQIRSSTVGATSLSNLRVTSVRDATVPVPCILTQRKIAAILSAYDDLIENNKRRIKVLEEMAQRIYREWFVDFRYPGHEGVPLVDSEVGPIPNGWSSARLGDEVEFVYGKALTADARRDGSVIVFGSGGVIGQHDEALSAGPGIVVGRKGNVGAVHWSDGPFFAIDTTYWVRSEMPLTYCYFALRDMEFLDSHAAVPGLSRAQAYALPLVCPSRHVLETFDGLVADLFALRARWAAATTNLRATRDVLLPRLVSGEIDVTDLEINVSGLAA